MDRGYMGGGDGKFDYVAHDQQTHGGKGSSGKVPYEAGQKHSHDVTDSKDQRSIANRLAAAERENAQSSSKTGSKDPRQAALSHGNEPSKGAKIDAELMEDDAKRMREKGHKEPAGSTS
ncbi:hypothetical protein EX30DRAFT_339674 [Ascodesmis nigricans]|uniref:Uncharacterized protein n=1 Tax=Ascodesmis nigricans TaxID=341454 RepID=A0A4S2N015_9PEZI|nr:hypothetical protein EX30DRAFT_339674 [Ascodesmis nigricans]